MKLLSKKAFSFLWAIVLLPVAVIAQQPGGPTGGGGGAGGTSGGNPDQGLDNPVVPFDSNMTLVFLLAAIVFAFMVVKKKANKEAQVS